MPETNASPITDRITAWNNTLQRLGKEEVERRTKLVEELFDGFNTLPLDDLHIFDEYTSNKDGGRQEMREFIEPRFRQIAMAINQTNADRIPQVPLINAIFMVCEKMQNGELI